MRVENKPIFPFFFFFLSGCRIVEKKRYDKLNDAAYSALKYRVCAANFFIKCCNKQRHFIDKKRFLTDYANGKYVNTAR